MFKTAVSVVILLLSHFVFAQEKFIDVPTPPSITITPIERSEKAIEISNFDVSSEIIGNLVQTTLTLSFYNPNNRNVSADFVFPIPTGSILNGYALDINGIMVDGVAVEKHKARVTFEKIVRQGIDPGLVEKVAGNVFKTRIFPLEANKNRSIKVKFSSILKQNKGNYSYQIPLMTNQLVKNFSLKISATNTQSKPIITNSQFDDLNFSQWSNQFVTEFTRKNFTLKKPLSIEVPQLRKNQVIIGSYNNKTYFSINPALKPNQTKPKKYDLKHIQLVWDASHSQKSANHQLDLNLLDAFFKKQRDIIVELYLLRNTSRFIKRFTIKNGDWSTIKQKLNSVNYDGATNLSELNRLLDVHSKAQAILLFSDGLHTIDKKQNIKLDVPLHVFTSSLSANTDFNQQIASQNNGRFNLLTNQSDFSDIVNNLNKPLIQLMSVTINNGQVSGLPNLPMISDYNSIISAQLLSNKASITLNYGYKGKIVESATVEISKDKAVDSQLPELIWAQQQLSYLQKDAQENKQSIIKLSQEYDLVSDFTSLIVLDNLQQYVEHKIVPPKSLAKMRNDYYAQIKQQKKDKHQVEVDKISQVITLWEQRKEWWNKDFPKFVKPKPKKVSMAMREDNESEDREELDRVVATGSHLRMNDVAEESAGVGSSNAAVAQMEMKKEKSSSSITASVKISEWNPDTPYLKVLKNTEKHNRLSKYYQLKQDYLNSPAFYFDCANFFFQNKQPKVGLQILSNIAELTTQDSRLLRTMAMKLKQHGYIELSIQTYRKVLTDRPEEPQSLRDLALALEIRANKQDYQEAIELLYKVITTRWDRFHGIEITILMELNRLIPIAEKLNLEYGFINEKLIALLDVDFRIVLSWDSDMTDIDLWVVEPSGEKVTYSKTLSRVGGMFHQDFTGGYGPEEYLIHKAPKGDYSIKVHFYGNNSPELSGATTLYVDVYTNYSRKTQSKQTLSLRLENADDDYLVGTISL